MNRLAIGLGLLGATLGPAAAQDAVPLLRVYIDAPYYYEFMAVPGTADAAGIVPVSLSLDGKEIGAADIAYNCANGTYDIAITEEFTGNSGDYIDTALLAFGQLQC
ncbi:MAG: hypothetical protein JWR75_679 [Devosia sp.]|nr:hypothetical protein [Devosia sp.]